jgi:hypothetical protein
MPDLLNEYCSPEMAQLMKEFGELTEGVHFVRQVVMRHPHTGQVQARYYVPIDGDVKGELRNMIVKGHGLGYVEATEDWG